jgi:NAD(P)-dependent dehydrogenase (short-subunit alcohol dehydrogenase family)
LGASEPTVRAATSDDLDPIGEIYAHHVLTGVATFETTPPDREEWGRRFRAVTKALLPLLQAGRGRVVNVTSVGGKAAIPMMAPYVAAKHGLEGLSDVLRLEFRRLGVYVSVIEPGFIATSMGGKLQRDTVDEIAALPEDGRRRYGLQMESIAESISEHAASGSRPEVVADAVLHALTSDKPRTRYPTGEGAKRILLLRRILPDRRFDKVILKAAGLG